TNSSNSSSHPVPMARESSSVDPQDARSKPGQLSVAAAHTCSIAVNGDVPHVRPTGTRGGAHVHMAALPATVHVPGAQGLPSQGEFGLGMAAADTTGPVRSLAAPLPRERILEMPTAVAAGP